MSAIVKLKMTEMSQLVLNISIFPSNTKIEMTLTPKISHYNYLSVYFEVIKYYQRTIYKT